MRGIIGRSVKAVLIILPMTALAKGGEPDLLLMQADDPAPQRPVVVLNAAEPVLDANEAEGGLLYREIARQAVLIAIRDGLGLTTRDVTLRESAEANKSTTIDISTRVVRAQGMRIRLSDRRRSFWEKDIPLPHGNERDYLMLATALEALSRGELIDVLRQAGLEGRTVAPDSDTPVPADVHTLVSQLDFVSQFAAVRRVHGLIRSKGESSELLGLLVRGYANLGLLTQFHYTGAHKAFAARALLYAERMYAKDSYSPYSQCHRVYARAMAGLHGPALTDLERINDKTELPPWVELIDAYCRYDTKRLAKVTEPRLTPLAALLTFLATEHSGSSSVVLESAQAAMQTSPYCFRVIDAANDSAGVGYNHEITTIAPVFLAAALRERLGAIPELPANTRALLGHLSPEQAPVKCAKVANSLLTSTDATVDDGEPAWQLLAPKQAKFSGFPRNSVADAVMT